MKINKPKLIIRILEILSIIATFIITPIAIDYARAWRGYEAVGGEYLIPLLTLCFIMILESILEEIERRRKEKKNGRR